MVSYKNKIKLFTIRPLLTLRIYLYCKKTDFRFYKSYLSTYFERKL